jgi:nucleoid DNA-binding protein
LTKVELVDLLFDKVGFNKRETKAMVEWFFEEVRLALENGEGVKHLQNTEPQLVGLFIAGVGQQNRAT